MTRRTMLLTLMGLGVVGIGTLVVWADEGHEEEVALDQVPPAVKATILKETAEAKINEIERETANGKTIYEVEFLRDGKEIEIQIASDGTVLGREVEEEQGDEDDLTMEQVPEPARSALMKLAGGARIIEAEREQEYGAVVYEAEWVTSGTKYEAAVTADGALVETEEIIPVEKAPQAVRSAIAKHFPAGAKVTVERKMVVIYEVEARIDGKEREVLVLPTGKVLEGHDDDDSDNNDDD
jgi:uncharacterized membrane protein YkoI